MKGCDCDSDKHIKIEFNLDKIFSVMVKTGLILSIAIYSVFCLAFIVNCFSLK